MLLLMNERFRRSTSEVQKIDRTKSAGSFPHLGSREGARGSYLMALELNE